MEFVERAAIERGEKTYHNALRRKTKTWSREEDGQERATIGKRVK